MKIGSKFIFQYLEKVSILRYFIGFGGFFYQPLLLQVSERLNLASSGGKDQEDDEYECQVCNANLFVSLVSTFDDHGDDDSFDDNDDNNDNDVDDYKCQLCKSLFHS